ncbi:MAG TPA: DUF4013 domain-containing protein [Gemmataceae bacterium]|jgi:hypothetical protein
MRYLHSYQYVFISPRWLNNLGLGTVCQFVPIAGDIVLLGYHFEMIEAMIRDGEENYPDFNMNRLMPYLKRGIWPFLIQLIAGIPLAILLILFCIIFLVAIVGAGGEPSYGVLLLFVFFFLASIVFGVVVMPFLVLPLEIGAGLGNGLRAAFSRAFYGGFVKRCWKELLLVQLFTFVCGSFLVLIGALLFCFGAYPARALVMFSRSHLCYQVYMLYLERGGSPPAAKKAIV